MDEKVPAIKVAGTGVKRLRDHLILFKLTKNCKNFDFHNTIQDVCDSSSNM